MKLSTLKLQLLVLVACCLLLVASSTEGAEASLFLSPGSGEYQIGSTFLVRVKVNSNGAPINAAKAKILFPRGLLEVKSVSKTDSIFTFWPEEPIFSNSRGEVNFQGGVPAPGFTGVGTIFAINFRAKKVGQAKVSFSEAAVLAADGRGTDILAFIQGATFSITEVPPEIVEAPAPPKISSPTHPKENLWYQNPDPKFQWKVSPDIIGVSYKFDQSPFSIPGAVSEEVVSSKSYEGVEDGSWYFHLRIQNKAGWSRTSHYKVQIDTTPPHPFDVVIDNQGDSTNPRPFLYFETEDDLSGISHYEIKIGEGDTFSLVRAQTSPFQLPHQAPGSYKILVKAIDRAGNFREAATLLNVESILIPKILIYPETYIAGEEVFYVEGTALSNVTVIIFFKRNDKLIKKWEVGSDENGIWLFSTDELFKSGNYTISARSKDERGAISDSSPEYQVKVILGGISIGPWIFTYRTLFLILIILTALIMAIIIYLILSKKRKVEKETREAADSLKKTFNDLKKKITKRIERLDFRPGLSPKEKIIRDELIEILERSEKIVRKEIEDIEKELE